MAQIRKYFSWGVIIIFLVLLVNFLNPILIPKVYSQNANCITVNPRYSNGILTTPTLQNGSRFGTASGQCVLDPVQAGIVSFKIPTYDDLKNTYFQRKTSTTGTNAIDKQTITGNQTNLDLRGGNGDKLWNITGDLYVTACPNAPGPPCKGKRSAVIFIDGNLNIGDMNVLASDKRTPLDVSYDDPDSGIVYIVKGNVNFGRDVRRFDGVIISAGTVCTSVDAGKFCLADAHYDTDPGGETKQLVINGNLISLESTLPIKFERNLIFSIVAFPGGNDTTPAELINLQPKFMVVLRNILSETLTIQTEDTHYAQNQ